MADQDVQVTPVTRVVASLAAFVQVTSSVAGSYAPPPQSNTVGTTAACPPGPVVDEADGTVLVEGTVLPDGAVLAAGSEAPCEGLIVSTLLGLDPHAARHAEEATNAAKNTPLRDLRTIPSGIDAPDGGSTSLYRSHRECSQRRCAYRRYQGSKCQYQQPIAPARTCK